MREIQKLYYGKRKPDKWIFMEDHSYDIIPQLTPTDCSFNYQIYWTKKHTPHWVHIMNCKVHLTYGDTELLCCKWHLALSKDIQCHAWCTFFILFLHITEYTSQHFNLSQGFVWVCMSWHTHFITPESYWTWNTLSYQPNVISNSQTIKSPSQRVSGILGLKSAVAWTVHLHTYLAVWPLVCLPTIHPYRWCDHYIEVCPGRHQPTDHDAHVPPEQTERIVKLNK